MGKRFVVREIVGWWISPTDQAEAHAACDRLNAKCAA